MIKLYDVQYILDYWLPGDCEEDHLCRTECWDQLDNNKSYYDKLKAEISRGFKASLTAYKSSTSVVLVDGHSRFQAARELDVQKVPVYVSSHAELAKDSGFWDGEGVDTPWTAEYARFIGRKS